MLLEQNLQGLCAFVYDAVGANSVYAARDVFYVASAKHDILEYAVHIFGRDYDFRRIACVHKLVGQLEVVACIYPAGLAAPASTAAAAVEKVAAARLRAATACEVRVYYYSFCHCLLTFNLAAVSPTAEWLHS